MGFLHLVRRLHLYLGLGLLPWFLMYGISSVPFAHPSWLQSLYKDGTPDWTRRLDREYSIDLPSEEGAMRAVGARMLRDGGVPEGAFGTYRHPDGRLETYRHDFWTATRVIYSPEQKRLVVEERRFRWDHLLTGMHARGGFEQDGALQTLWGVVVDLVSLGMLLWVVSGLLMWWTIPGHFRWGLLALVSGMVAFVVFLVGL